MSKSQNQGLFAPYLLILRRLVAIVEQLQVQVFVLLEEILKLILLDKRGRKKTVFRSQEVPMIRPVRSTQTQHVVSDSLCIIHLRRLLEVAYALEAILATTTIIMS